jgi:hypothetical protein
MVKMLTLHSHTGFGPTIRGLTDALETCQECCGPKYSHFQHAGAVSPQYPPLKLTPHFLDVPKENDQRDQVW